MRLLDRRLIVAAAVTATMLVGAAFGLAACGPKGGAVTAEDMTLGDPKAPVTVVEYASVACPICGTFNNTQWPAFKAKYVDTGKVHYISREMLTGNQAVAAAGFLMARCAGKDKYFAVTDAVYHAQAELYADGTENAPNARPILLGIAKQMGMSEADFDKCVSDEKALNALNDRVTKYMKNEKIDSTPTFVVNGKVIVGGLTADDLGKAVDEAAKK